MYFTTMDWGSLLYTFEFIFIWLYNMDQREIIMKNLERIRSRKLNKEEFTNEYLKLKRQSATYRAEKIYPTTVSERPENNSKNRYKDILPYDHSRVKLSFITSDKDSDYINANFIKGVYEPRTYIATQGPLSTTVVDFWRMIWEYKILIIVMACMEFEMGKKKCERYWVDVDESPLQLGPFFISCEAEEKRKEYVIRKLKVKLNDSEIRSVYHFHYKNWPDHDVPSSINSIFEFINEMHCYQVHNDAPICVHCSAGCGRTGVICAIDYTWTLLKDSILPVNFSIFNIIQEMRTQRPLLVQTQGQYKLVYDAVIELFKRQIEAFSNQTDPVTVETEVNQPAANIPQDPHMEKSSVKQPNSSAQGEQKKSQCSGHDAQSLDNLDKNRDGASLVRPALSVGALSPSANRNTGWDSWLANQPLHKHHSLDFNYCFWTDPLLTLKMGDKTGIGLDTKVHPTQIKSTPLQSVSQKTLQPLTNMDSGSGQCGGFQLDSSLSSKLSNNTPHCKLRNLCHQHCIWSSEDPYFSSLSSEEPCSPALPESSLSPPTTVSSSLSLATAFAAQSLESPEPSCSLEGIPPAQDTHPLDAEESVCQSSPQQDEDIPPPLPERTPESFIILGEDNELQQLDKPLLAASDHQLSSKNDKIKISTEWNSMSQLKHFDDSVRLRPSKSGKLQRPRSEFHWSRSSSPPTPPLPERTPESFFLADEDSCSSVTNIVVNPGDLQIKSTNVPTKETKGFRRSKSLKILRNVKNSIWSSPSLVRPPEHDQSNHHSSLLSLGFANRFSRPRGPRNPPPNWNV
ncbi:tyrosine-protein phosphatase non-receptor type 22 isoform X1 [Python bivittatus]|uniref:protein-tyrosine-phosphatase n=2 Tax=Python bivittatus TaxID=176946 RepID=A0A9F5IFH6_PYTBI|nr:tyrosine-protein phosphatase non-receptor type 22 isoform X1 [Python bivittatus]